MNNWNQAPIDSISVVVPVYNSELVLKELTRRLEPILTTIPKHELILVNDGSKDRSWNVICELTASHSWIAGINLMRNYGQHNALLCGIQAAHNEVIVTIDDDLQNPPEGDPENSSETVGRLRCSLWYTRKGAARFLA